MGELASEPAAERFWEAPLDTLDRAQWEALCDGCGLCCMHKLEDEDGSFHATNVACRLLDPETIRCRNYRRRHYYVPDCIRLTPRKLAQFGWLPETCAYRLRSAGEPLPAWHYLVCGDRQAVHRAGISVRNPVCETEAGPLEDHVIDDAR